MEIYLNFYFLYIMFSLCFFLKIFIIYICYRDYRVIHGENLY